MRLKKITPLLSHFPETVSVPISGPKAEFAMKAES